MKTKFFFAVASVLLLWHTTIAQSPALQRTKGVGLDEGSNSFSGKGYAIITDASGSVYTMGLFRGTVDFDPGKGTFNLTAAGTKDIFIQKTSASGNFIWAKSVRLNKTLNGSFTASRSNASENVYTKRALAVTADFDQEKETSGLTTTPYSLGDIFILKLNAAGNFIWANSVASTGGDKGNSIAVDASGNIYCTGNFSSIADFDKVAGTKTSFGLYPNPTNGDFVINMKLNEEVNKDAVVQVYNALGKLVITKNIPMVHGVLYKEMKLDKTLATGIYSVRVIVNEKILQRQMIYQR